MMEKTSFGGDPGGGAAADEKPDGPSDSATGGAPAGAPSQGSPEAAAPAGAPSPEAPSSAGPDASAPRRPMRVTPGSGSFAALLAHSRPRLTRADISVAKPPAEPGQLEPGQSEPGQSGPGQSGPFRAGAAPDSPEEITAVGSAIPRAAFRDDDSGASTRIRPVGPVGPALLESTDAFVDSGATTLTEERPLRKAVIPRPTRLTPGAGGLSPLGEPGAPGQAMPPFAGAAGSVAAPSVAAAAPESVPQSKNSEFAATIHGIPRPDTGVPGGAGWVDTSWTAPVARGGPSKAGHRNTPASLSVMGGRDRSPVSSTGQWEAVGAGAAPVNVDDGGLTEPTAAPRFESGPVFSLSGGFSDSDAFQGTNTAPEAMRITERLGVVAPSHRRRNAVVAGAATGVALLALGLLWPSARTKPRPSNDAPAATTTPAVPAVRAAPSVDNAAPPVPALPPSAEDPPSGAPGVPASDTEVEAAAASVEPAASGEPPTIEPPPPKRGNRATRTAARLAATSAASTRKAEARAARAAARLAKAEARAAKARVKGTLAKRKVDDKAAGVPDATAAAEVRAGTPRARTSADVDPDGTLPLTGR